MRRRMLTAPNGLPCVPPPWGASSRSTSRPARARGTFRSAIRRRSGPRPRALSKTPLGTPNLGGPIITAGGVVFIGATMDHALRAFDVETGRELWKGELPGGARATPMTYAINGRQFVVISVGGSEEWGKGDYVVAFALPRWYDRLFGPPAGRRIRPWLPQSSCSAATSRPATSCCSSARATRPARPSRSARRWSATRTPRSSTPA